MAHPSSRTTNAPARSLSRGGTAQEVASCLFSPHTTCISSMFSTLVVLFHMQWVPPAARPLCRTTLPLSSPSILPKPPRETRAPLSILRCNTAVGPAIPAVPRPCPSGSRRVRADTGGSRHSRSRCLPAAGWSTGRRSTCPRPARRAGACGGRTRLRRTLGDGNPSGNRETRRPPAATPAPPPATTGGRMTGGGACAVWRACGRPCAARGRRCSSGPSTGPSSDASDASAGTAVRTCSRWTGNHMLRLISLLMLDGLRPGKRAIFLTLVPLPTSIRMTWRSSSDRCEHAFPP